MVRCILDEDDALGLILEANGCLASGCRYSMYGSIVCLKQNLSFTNSNHIILRVDVRSEYML